MPELPPSWDKLPSEIERKVPEYRSLSLDIGNIDELEEKEILIGHGASRFVVPSEDNPNEKVLVIKYTTELKPLQAKQIYYSQKIMNILFPHNFPHTYAVFAGDYRSEDYMPTEIRQRIATQEQTVEPNKTRLYNIYENLKKVFQKKQTLKFPYSEVMSFYKEMGLNEYRGDHDDNFILGTDGGQYFIDVLFEENSVDLLGLLKLDPKKLEEYMAKHSYSESSIKSVGNSLRRLKTISPKDGPETKIIDGEAITFL